MTCPLELTGRPEWNGDEEGLHLVAAGIFDRRQIGLRAPRFMIGAQIAVTLEAWLAPPR